MSVNVLDQIKDNFEAISDESLNQLQNHMEDCWSTTATALQDPVAATKHGNIMQEFVALMTHSLELSEDMQARVFERCARDWDTFLGLSGEKAEEKKATIEAAMTKYLHQALKVQGAMSWTALETSNEKQVAALLAKPGVSESIALQKDIYAALQGCKAFFCNVMLKHVGVLNWLQLRSLRLCLVGHGVPRSRYLRVRVSLRDGSNTQLFCLL